jgi:hypothetical protein
MREMTKQKFQIGQRVGVATSSLSGPTTMEPFRIINTYLVQGRERVYRLRQIDAPHERVVPEVELRRLADY